MVEYPPPPYPNYPSHPGARRTGGAAVFASPHAPTPTPLHPARALHCFGGRRVLTCPTGARRRVLRVRTTCPTA